MPDRSPVVPVPTPGTPARAALEAQIEQVQKNFRKDHSRAIVERKNLALLYTNAIPTYTPQLGPGLFLDQTWDAVGVSASKAPKRSTKFYALSTYLCDHLPQVEIADSSGGTLPYPVTTYTQNADSLYRVLWILSGSREVPDYVQQFLTDFPPKEYDRVWNWGLSEERLLQSPALPWASWTQRPGSASIARDRVERARSVCENLERQAQLAAARFQAAQYILATEQSLFAPIRRLPTEIITEILCLLSHQQGFMALSQVCRTWRSHCTVPAIQRFIVLTSERTYSHNYMGFFPHATLLAHPDQASWVLDTLSLLTPTATSTLVLHWEAPVSRRLLSSFLEVPLLWTSFRVERYNELDTVASALLRSTIPRMLNLSSLSLNGHVDQRITTPPSVSSLSLRYVPLGEQVIDCDWSRILTYRETGTRPKLSVAHLRLMTSLTTLTLVGVSLPTESVALPTLYTLRITGTPGIRQKDDSPIGLVAVNLAVLELSGVPHQGAHILPLVNILQARHVDRIQADFIQPEEIAELFRLNASLDLELGNEGPASFFSSLTNVALQALTDLPLLTGSITTPGVLEPS
ncbi:hypothetical protein B0H11DRAFT_1911286 [Mycena galericulata]|nr:hypothetical protein B0H11DRAFT_1911286 [Mycena galericulata]